MQSGGLLPLHYAETVVPAAVGDSGELVGHRLGFHLLAVLVELNVGVDPGLDNQRVERLGNIVHRPQHKPPLLVLDGGEAGDQNHGEMLGEYLLLELLQQHEAVHFRHDHIQQNQGVVPSGGLGQSLRRRLHGGNVVFVL